MTPHQQALSYCIWAHCDPLGWNVTIGECADALGVSLARVRNAVTAKGWGGRFRTVEADHAGIYFGEGSRGLARTRLDEVAEVPRAFEVAE